MVLTVRSKTQGAPMYIAADVDSEMTTELALREPFVLMEERGPWARGFATHYSQEGWIQRRHLEQVLCNASDWWQSQIKWRGWAPHELAREKFFDKPYFWGGLGLGPDGGIDCSGLVAICYRYVGIQIPRDAHQQEFFAQKLRLQDLRPGDLITYDAENAGMATHIAFLTDRTPNGQNVILHATGREGVMKVVEEIETDYLCSIRRKVLCIPF